VSLFAVAAWIVGIACGVIVVAGFYAIAIDRPEHHSEAFGVCTPSRKNTLTGAYQEPQEARLSDEQQEIERLRAVIRQRNRTINKLRAEREQQPVQTPEPVVTKAGSLERFANLEIRGQS